MAIAKVNRPAVVLDGVVEAIEGLTKKNSSEVWAHEITLRQQNDAFVGIRVWPRTAEKQGLPSVGDYLAAECSVEESRDFGTILHFERPAFDALDRMHSTLGAAA